MKNDDIISKIDQILRTVFSLKDQDLDNLSRLNCEYWTSLAHVELFFAVEEEFELRLSDDEMAFVESRQDLLDIVKMSIGTNE